MISNLTPGALAIYWMLEGSRLACRVVRRTPSRVGIDLGVGRVRYVKPDAIDYPRDYQELLALAKLEQQQEQVRKTV